MAGVFATRLRSDCNGRHTSCIASHAACAGVCRANELSPPSITPWPPSPPSEDRRLLTTVPLAGRDKALDATSVFAVAHGFVALQLAALQLCSFALTERDAAPPASRRRMLKPRWALGREKIGNKIRPCQTHTRPGAVGCGVVLGTEPLGGVAIGVSLLGGEQRRGDLVVVRSLPWSMLYTHNERDCAWCQLGETRLDCGRLRD